MNVPSNLKCCTYCNVKGLNWLNFACHLKGRKHIKNVDQHRAKNPSANSKCLLMKSSKPLQDVVSEIILYFCRYDLIDAQILSKLGGVLEFSSQEAVTEVMKTKHVVLDINLELSPYQPPILVGKRLNAPNANGKTIQENLPPLSMKLQEILKRKFVDENLVQDNILSIISEIELKPMDYREREKTRFIMENFLHSIFPECTGTYIFGSSANNLGFVGCDLDMVVNLGFDLWSKEDGSAEEQAAQLTKFLANEIRKRKRGYDVVPIAKARVPIVKFTDNLNGLQVDLSFKNGMPIFNTALIKLYTRTHRLVRPYMMLLRLWAKAQDVAGGGRPGSLLTNYCLCMLMIFWLMKRQRPIVPCVGELQEMGMYYNVRPVIINGWNFGFSDNVSKWHDAFHPEKIMDLAEEFFDFYGHFEPGKWVVSPLTGTLIKRQDVRSGKPSCPQRYMDDFYKFRVPLRVSSPLVVQDPMELCNNISHAFKETALKDFQLLCRTAAGICKDIKEGRDCLQSLFYKHNVRSTIIKDMNRTQEKNGKDAKANVEVVNLDEKADEEVGNVEPEEEAKLADVEVVSVSSQESIELQQELESLEREGELVILKEIRAKEVSGTVATSQASSDECQILSTAQLELCKGATSKGGSAIEAPLQLLETEVIALEREGAGMTPGQDPKDFPDACAMEVDESGTIEVDEVELLQECSAESDFNERYSFQFDLGPRTDLDLSSDWNLKIKKGKSDEASPPKALCAEGFLLFLLKHVLKCVVLETQPPISADEDEDENDPSKLTVKRKGDETQVQSPSKLLKDNDGLMRCADSGFSFVSRLKCEIKFNVWEGRSKKLKNLRNFNFDCFEREVALSNFVFVAEGLEERALDLEFETTLWRRARHERSFCVTCRFDSEDPKEKKKFETFFNFYSRMAKALALRTNATFTPLS